MEHGETGSKADVDFHDTIAEGCGNSILSALVIMLGSHVWLNQVIAAIRTKVGGRLVVDHEAILHAIKTRKPERARKAMEQHLDKLISDVDRYWDQVFPQRDKR